MMNFKSLMSFAFYIIRPHRSTTFVDASYC